MRIKKNFQTLSSTPVAPHSPVVREKAPAPETGTATLRAAPSRSRVESNAWLRLHAATVGGPVLSLGSRDDADGEGGAYRDYFSLASSYTTSDISGATDLALDVRHMAGIADNRYCGIFCSGVLEHVDDFHAALSEITRILAPAGTLLLGVPFRQAIHDAPGDFWRFTRFAIEHLLSGRYAIVEIKDIDRDPVSDFPAAYWVKAIKNIA